MSLTRERLSLEAFELGFGEAALGLVHGDAGGFFDDGAAIHGLGVEDLADAALLDDGVGIRAEAHGHEEFVMSRRRTERPLRRYSLWPERYRRRPTTTSPGRRAMACLVLPRFLRNLRAGGGGLGGGVFISPSAVTSSPAASRLAPSGSGCVIVFSGSGRKRSRIQGRLPRRRCPPEDLGGGFGEFGIDQGELHLGDAHRGALDSAVEDAVGHALGAQELVALLAQDPGNGVDDVGLAAAVGADDAGDPCAG